MQEETVNYQRHIETPEVALEHAIYRIEGDYPRDVREATRNTLRHAQHVVVFGY